MGPEEIHIYFWEGKCDRPKKLKVFLVNFKICCLALVAVVFPFVQTPSSNQAGFFIWFLSNFGKSYQQEWPKDLDEEYQEDCYSINNLTICILLLFKNEYLQLLVDTTGSFIFIFAPESTPWAGKAVKMIVRFEHFDVWFKKLQLV